MCFPLVVEVLCSSLFCCALLLVLSSFAIILNRKRAGFFTFIVLRVSCICSVTLPHSALGWSVFSDCGIS